MLIFLSNQNYLQRLFKVSFWIFPLKTLCISLFVGIQNKLLQKECIALALVAAFFKNLGCWWRIQVCVSVFWQKVYSLWFLRKIYVKDSCSVVLTKILVSFLVFLRRKSTLIGIGWNPCVFTHVWECFYLSIYFKFCSSSIYTFRFLINWAGFVFQCQWERFAYG